MATLVYKATGTEVEVPDEDVDMYMKSGNYERPKKAQPKRESGKKMTKGEAAKAEDEKAKSEAQANAEAQAQDTDAEKAEKDEQAKEQAEMEQKTTDNQ